MKHSEIITNMLTVADGIHAKYAGNPTRASAARARYLDAADFINREAGDLASLMETLTPALRELVQVEVSFRECSPYKKLTRVSEFETLVNNIYKAWSFLKAGSGQEVGLGSWGYFVRTYPKTIQSLKETDFERGVWKRGYKPLIQA